MIIFVTF